MLFDIYYTYKNMYNINEFRTEIWSLDENDNAKNVKMAEPYLKDYRTYPELFVVASDFCTKN